MRVFIISKVERVGYIYEIRCIVHGKGYVGQTIKDPKVRWAQHIYAAFVKKDRRPLYCAMRKYGLRNFTAEVVWTGPESKLNAAEKRLVRQRKTFIDTGWGYNLTTGGAHFKHSKATCRKLSRIAREIMATQPAVRMRLANIVRGVPQSEPRKAHMREKGLAHKASRVGKSYFGRKATAKISAANLGKKRSAASCEVNSKSKLKWFAEHDAPPVSKKECQRRSRSAIRQWQTMRPKMLRTMRTAMNEPEYCSKRSEIAKAQWARMRDEMCASLKVGHNTPTAKANHAKETKRRWRTGIISSKVLRGKERQAA